MKNNQSKILIIFFCSLLIGQTNDQIKTAKQIIKAKGLNKDQVKKMALEQGYSENQINMISGGDKSEKSPTIIRDEKIDVEVPDLGKTNNSIETKFDDKQKRIEDQKVLEIVDDTFENESKIEKNSEEYLSYFGYDIFNNDPALFQATSIGAIDPNHLIGPGDEIIVMLWGETQFRQELTVNREGFIFIPEIGQVFVNGLNLKLLESKLYRVFSQSYASLDPQNGKATTFLDVSLGNIRPLRIQVLGEVNQPGAYTVSPSTTLFSSLYYFNGPSVLGSLRDIRLIRAGKQITSIDFYDYLLTGKKPKDENLQIDDVIFFPKRIKSISIEGEINRQGIYEIKADETLDDLISIAGDIKISAYLDRAQIDRIVPFNDRSRMGMDRMIVDVNLGEVIYTDKTFDLQDGDKIKIFSVLDQRQNIVSISGAIQRPGDYDLGSGLAIKDLIIKADSLLGDAYLQRVDVIRLKPDGTEKLIKLNLFEVLEEKLHSGFSLMPMDRGIVYSVSEMVPNSYVSISGHVKNPGRYLLRETMNLYDLIFKAGGFVDEEFRKKTYLKRAELIRVQSDSDIKEIIPFNLELVLENLDIAQTLLQPDDLIRIYSLSEIVGDKRFISITGHVKRPGDYELYEKNMTIQDLVFKAGGFDDPLFKRNTFLERADLVRYNDDQITQKIIPFNLETVLNDKEHKTNLVLKPGDLIRTYSKSVFNTIRPVTINGTIENPGNYSFKSSMTLKDLILEAGGVTKNVFRYKVEVARIDPNNNNEQDYANSFIFDMDSDYYTYNYIEPGANTNQDTISNNFYLEPYDFVSIRPDPNFNLQRKVTITGQVNYPGEYAIISSEEKISDLISRSGGLKEKAFLDGSSFIRENIEILIDLRKIIKTKNSKYDLKLQDGDKLIITKKPDMYEVRGQVNVPGFYKYVKGYKVDDAIRHAGGISLNGNRDDIFVIHPNGRSYKYSRLWKNKRLKDGSIVNVGEIPEKEQLDKTEYAKELTSILANLAQAISLVFIAIQN